MEIIRKEKAELLTPEQAKIEVLILELKKYNEILEITTAKEKEIRSIIFNSGITKYINEEENFALTVSQTEEQKYNEVVVKTDYEKAVQYAKDNNLVIPMIIDCSQLVKTKWFLENQELFTTKEIVEKVKKGTQRLLWKIK